VSGSMAVSGAFRGERGHSDRPPVASSPTVTCHQVLHIPYGAPLWGERTRPGQVPVSAPT
jgi:hypothetical protein